MLSFAFFTLCSAALIASAVANWPSPLATFQLLFGLYFAVDAAEEFTR